MGIIAFAFAWAARSDFAGLLHMSMHSLTSRDLLHIGHIRHQGTQKIAEIVA